jgi:hypothetical protein
MFWHVNLHAMLTCGVIATTWRLSVTCYVTSCYATLAYTMMCYGMLTCRKYVVLLVDPYITC